MAKVKKDFSKDLMYSKIMPTNTPADPSPAPAQTRQTAVNLFEAIVADKLPHTIRILQGCDCEQCRQDIIALTLNELPCAYAVVDSHQLDRKSRELRSIYEVKITSAMIKSVGIVKANPRHSLG